ncbi:MAG: HAD family phosphatase [Psychrilyobacter sp.]|uniref:HAD hydrolase-like protein n=1 Tax=Psychrilyobacter sp. TaxID=2586924 RepID=UPI003C70DE8C
MKIKGILFDKDGTLIKFGSMWISISKNIIGDIFKKYNIDGGEALIEKLFLKIGISGHEVDGRGLLATKTVFEIADAWYEALRNIVELEIDEFRGYVKERFNFHSVAQGIEIEIIDGVEEILRSLKNKGTYLGVATADTKESTEFSLKMTGIYHYFDYIGTDDGTTKKNLIQNYLKDFV